MLFSKQNSQFNKVQRELYKKLNELETEVRDSELRKRITILIDKTASLKATQNIKMIELMEVTMRYVSELIKELMNPVEMIINNYLGRIESLLNQIKYESGE